MSCLALFAAFLKLIVCLDIENLSGRVIDIKSYPQNMKKLNSATSGSKAANTLPHIIPLIISYAKNAAFNNASHLTLIGIIRNNLTIKSGNNTAKAKNMDRFKKFGTIYTE